MLKSFYPLVLLFVVSSAFADRIEIEFNPNWTREDSYRQAAATALFVADWYQTRYFIKHPCRDGTQTCVDPYFENGPAQHFLGKHPSVGKLNTFAVAGIAGHAAISYMLPPECRKFWQYVSIGYEADNVYKNHIGLRMGF